MIKLIKYLPITLKIYFFRLLNRKIRFGHNYKIHYPFLLYLGRKSTAKIGNNFILSDSDLNPTISSKNSKIILAQNSELIIGNNVAMSSPYLYASTKIEIGNNCIFGGNVTLVDTDFHSLSHLERRTDSGYINSSPIIIGDDVFVGTKVIILKGVQIGKCSIIAAGSVVTNNIPDGQIWGGNPARFIKHV